MTTGKAGVLPEQNVYLVGFMAAGKTTIGKALARKCRRKFIDTDQIIEQQQGHSVSEIFAQIGEKHFRQLETTTIGELSKQLGLVVALGGGAVACPENWQIIRQTGVSIYLQWSLSDLTRRLLADDTRPLLRSKKRDRKQTIIRQLYHSRTNFYEEADYKIECIPALSPEQIASRILNLWSQ